MWTHQSVLFPVTLAPPVTRVVVAVAIVAAVVVYMGKWRRFAQLSFRFVLQENIGDLKPGDPENKDFIPLVLGLPRAFPCQCLNNNGERAPGVSHGLEFPWSGSCLKRGHGGWHQAPLSPGQPSK